MALKSVDVAQLRLAALYGESSRLSQTIKATKNALAVIKDASGSPSAEVAAIVASVMDRFEPVAGDVRDAAIRDGGFADWAESIPDAFKKAIDKTDREQVPAAESVKAFLQFAATLEYRAMLD